MSGNANQKLKLLYLMKILISNTDEEHTLTMKNIIVELSKHDISAERKSIYNDMELLKHLASQLQRQVFVFDRVKAINEKIYYNVDALHNAISSVFEKKLKTSASTKNWKTVNKLFELIAVIT